MADTKISALSSGAPAQATDEVVIRRGGTNPKLAVADLTTAAMAGSIIATGGTTAQTLSTKLGTILDAKDFGATGDGTTDDTTAVQAWLTELASSDNVGLLPPGNYKCASLDGKGVKYIMGGGVIKSTITAGQTALHLGTTVNANVDMNHGDITIRVQHNANSNSGLAGSIGVHVHGAAHCRFSIHSLYFDVGILAQPDDTANIYTAFCHFDHCRTYGTATGIRIRALGSGTTGWINECTWTAPSASSADNALTENAGIEIDSAGTLIPDNHIFIKPHVEALTTPIRIKAGAFNHFLLARLESSGSIVFGQNTDARVGGNVVTALFAQSVKVFPSVTHQAPMVNYVGSVFGEIWDDVVSVTANDWSADADGTGGRLAKMVCSATGTDRFDSVRVRNGHWSNGSNNSAQIWVAVQPGDVFHVETDFLAASAWQASTVYVAGDFVTNDGGKIYHCKTGGTSAGSGGPTGTGTSDITDNTVTWEYMSPGNTALVTVNAQDLAKVNLSTLTSGALPYIGSSRVASIALGTSNLGATFSTAPADYDQARRISANRSEVKFLRFDFRNTATFARIGIKRLRNRGNGAISITPSPAALFFGGSQTTVGAAGAASAVPANPTQYVEINVNGVELVVPAFAKA